MAYATVADVQARMTRTFSEEEANQCELLLDDAAVVIDAYSSSASGDAKQLVSVRMVLRLMEASGDLGVPMGATQGSQSALGYSQSWTISNGAAGELYLTKLEKKLLGTGDRIGSHSPLEDLRWFRC
ncbi:MAG: hypothetical protein IKH17_06390 [Bacteroidales bacterium]|nr:hypothetical protein [Bacteroidales bacterium]